MNETGLRVSPPPKPKPKSSVIEWIANTLFKEDWCFFEVLIIIILEAIIFL